MRPSRLEIEGFTSFRETAVIDFDGADVFALVGPTGSGKSSIVDAMGFALFGRVHRYGEKLVHAVISQGRTEARVRFDFTAGGSTCTAVRVVRRVGPGRATTKEARLERDGEVIAGDEKGLTAAVTELLGLDFDQYCRCVVLPQGAFAEFLHDTPKGRQDLLSNLLDLGHYRRMGQEAGQRAVAARTKAEFLEQRLTGDLAGATKAASEQAAAAVASLDALADKVSAALPQLDELASGAQSARTAADECSSNVRLLAKVKEPDDIAGLACSLLEARTAAEAAVRAAEQAEADAVAAAGAREALGDRRSADAAVAAYRRRAQLLERREPAVAAHEAAADVAERARAAAVESQAMRAQADAALEASRAANRAHALREHLETGEPCPVCLQVVPALPAVDEPADFAAAQRALKEADAVVNNAAVVVEKATAGLLKAESEVSALDKQLADVDIETAGFPDAAAAASGVARIDDAEAAATLAQARDRSARAAARTATERVAALVADEAGARRSFEEVRDTLTGLGPPAADRSDLAADWRQLTAWVATKRVEVEDEAASASSEADRLAAEHAHLRAEIEQWCADSGVDPRGRPPGEAVAIARTHAEAERLRVEAGIEEAERTRGELAVVRTSEQVAHTLALHLRADRFEKWLLDEALDELTDGATGMLQELSGGAYSLVLDDKSRDFAVVDHRNADEVRSVRTLSGGETFLASLALALALSERVADLAAAGAVKLEALFLDEGFGTLDADTLDAVASAIESLGASGRMVGLVTHVRELADRVPVRFEVAKGPVTSTVDKVLT